MKTCYMCNSLATTKEHAPPNSFFPKGYRENLITVPSCPAHNNDNSMDVEYVRSFIASPIQTKEVGRKHFNDKILRSFKRNRNLFDRVFTNSEPIIVDGKETRLIHIDLERFKSIMRAVAYAIYFHILGKSFTGSFDIYSPDLVSSQSIPPEHQRQWANIRSMLSSLQTKEVKMPQPDVFKLNVHQDNAEKFIYEFIFYGGFKVYAISKPFYYR